MVLVNIPLQIIERPQSETRRTSTSASATTSKVNFLSNKKSLFEKIQKSSISSKYKCIKCKRYELQLIVFICVHILISAPLMNLSSDLLDAIKNKTYHLKPVKMIQKKRRQNSPPEDFNIAKILARRIAMGYGNIEEDNKSIKSVDSNNSVMSIMSWGNIKRTGSIMSSGSIKSTESDMSIGRIKRVVTIQNLKTGSIKSYESLKSTGSNKENGSHTRNGSMR